MKCINVWAKNKGIRDNKLGYLGGISWAILVAKICQAFPNYSINRILEKFFELYSDWEWDRHAVMLEELKIDLEHPHNESNWNGDKDLEN